MTFEDYKKQHPKLGYVQIEAHITWIPDYEDDTNNIGATQFFIYFDDNGKEKHGNYQDSAKTMDELFDKLSKYFDNFEYTLADWHW